MTQGERIIRYIHDFGSISTAEAFMDLGISRLASRIYDLTQEGYTFERNTIHVKNRYGEPTRYTRYTLKETP